MKKIILLFCFTQISVVGQTYQVTTAAGTGNLGYHDSTATACEMNYPYGLHSDNDSLIFFSDGANGTVRKFNYETNVVTTIAGNGTLGFQDGVGSAARFNYPDDLFYKDGFLYVSDNINNAIRKIDLSNNSVTTIAGNGTEGYNGDGILAVNAVLSHPGGIIVDSLGDIIFADCYNYCIRRIHHDTIYTIAGVPTVYGYQDGPAAQALFHRPRYIALDSNRVLYITDINNNVIRKYSNGMVSTLAGTGVAGGQDGDSATATFSAPVGIASTFNNYLYVVDGGGNKLRKVDEHGNVSTIAGDGNFGFNDGTGPTAEFFYPQGVCYDEYGYIYMADRDNNRIRKITLPYSEAKKHEATAIVKYSERIALYPNPASTEVHVRNGEGSTYRIYDSFEHEVATGYVINGTILLNELANGVYILKMGTANVGSTTRITILK